MEQPKSLLDEVKRRRGDLGAKPEWKDPLLQPLVQLQLQLESILRFCPYYHSHLSYCSTSTSSNRRFIPFRQHLLLFLLVISFLVIKAVIRTAALRCRVSCDESHLLPSFQQQQQHHHDRFRSAVVPRFSRTASSQHHIAHTPVTAPGVVLPISSSAGSEQRAP